MSVLKNSVHSLDYSDFPNDTGDNPRQFNLHECVSLRDTGVSEREVQHLRSGKSCGIIGSYGKPLLSALDVGTGMGCDYARAG